VPESKGFKIGESTLDEDHWVRGVFEARPRDRADRMQITGDTAVLAAVLENNKGPTKRWVLHGQFRFATGLRGTVV
jgi:hypothetical protein